MNHILTKTDPEIAALLEREIFDEIPHALPRQNHSNLKRHWEMRLLWLKHSQIRR